MSRILVTGGAGFIGSNLTDRLIADNHEVTVVDNLSTGKKENINPKAEFINTDISQAEEFNALFVFEKDRKFDYIFHLAALPRIQPSIQEPVKYHKNNVDGTLNVLELARSLKVKRVIYSASSSVYGDQKSMPLAESMTPNPKNPYALHKLIGEYYCQIYTKLYGISTVCLRYFNVYGKRQPTEGAYATVIGIFLRQKKEGQPLTIIGDGSQRRDFTYIDDVIRANILAMDSQEKIDGEIINIGTGENYSINQLAEMIGGKTKYLKARPGEAKETLARNLKAQVYLHWSPSVALREGLKLCEST